MTVLGFEILPVSRLHISTFEYLGTFNLVDLPCGPTHVKSLL